MQRMTKPFICPECNQSFTGKDARGFQTARFPLILNCGHSICMNCIKQAARQHKAVTCPKCKRVTGLFDGELSVESLLPDLHVVGSLSTFNRTIPRNFKVKILPAGYLPNKDNSSNKTNRTEKCENCNASAKWRCDNCAANLCIKCFDYIHKGSKLFKKHHGRPLYNKSYCSTLQAGCQEHEQKAFEFFCEDDCELACSHCAVTGTHHGHNLVTLLEKNKSCIQDIVQATEEAQKIKARLKSTEKKIAIVSPENRPNTQNYELAIRDYFHELHCCLQIREAELLHKLLDIISKTMNPLEEIHEQVSENLKEVSSVLEDAATIVKNTYVTLNGVDLLKKLRQLSELPCHLVPIATARTDTDIQIHLDESLKETFLHVGAVEADVQQRFMLLSEKELPLDYTVDTIDSESTTTDGDTSSMNGSLVADPVSPGIFQRVEIPQKVIVKPKSARSFSHELVHVSNIKTPLEFWAQRDCDINKLRQLENNINRHCRREVNTVSPAELELGSLYLVQYGSDNKWYRARLKAILGELEISDTLNTASTIASSDDDQKKDPCDKSNSCDDTLGLSESTVVTGTDLALNCSSTVTDDSVCVNSENMEIISCENVEKTEAANSCANEESGEITTSCENNENSVNTDTVGSCERDGSEELHTVCEKSSENTKPEENSILVNTAFSETNGTVHTTPTSTVSETTKSWADTVEQAESFDGSLQPEATMETSVQQESTSSFKVLVQYVDYGNSEVVCISRLRMIQSEFLKLPYLALKCSLWEIDPYPGIQWSDESVRMFAKLIGNNEALMKVIDERNDVLYIDLCKPPVCDVLNDFPMSVREALVFLEVACFPNPQAKTYTGVRRHNIQTFLPPEQLSSGLKYNVLVSHVNSPTDFYVQQLGTGARYLSDMSFEFQDYYGNESQRLLLCVIVPSVGMACMAQFSFDKKWYRALVIGLPGGGMVKVFYVDFGNVEVIPCWQLAKVIDKFMKLPAQAVHCTLADVEPIDESGWSEEGTAWFKDATKKGVVSMMVHESTPKERNIVSLFEVTDVAIRCISGLLVVEGYGRSTGTRSSFTEERHYVPPERKTETERPYVSDERNQPVLKIKQKHNYTSVTISHCEDPGCIYIHNVRKDEKPLESLMKRLKEAYCGTEASQKEWAEGEFCVVFNPKDERWYRGRIITKKEDVITVLLLDFGWTVTVAVINLRVLEEEFLKDDIFAIKCHLTGILPAGDNKKWSRLSLEFFRELLSTHKILYVKTKGVCENDSHAIDLFVKEVKPGSAVDPDTITYCSISEKLIDEGLAIPAKRNVKNSKVVIEQEPETNSDPLDKQVMPSCSTVKTTSFSVSLIPADASLSWLPVVPLDEEEIGILPTYVGYDGCIYFHPFGEVDKQLRMMSDTLVKAFESGDDEHFIGMIQEGQICMARFFLDQKWYRAEVIKVLTDLVEVFFVDFGNMEKVRFENVQTRVAFLDIPKLCHKGFLHNAIPISSNGQWPEETLNFIHEQVVDKICHMRIEQRDAVMHISLELPGEISLLELLESKNFIRPTEKPLIPISIDDLILGRVKNISYTKMPILPLNWTTPVLVTGVFKADTICVQIPKVHSPTTQVEQKINEEQDYFLLMMEDLAENSFAFAPIKDPKPGMNCCGMYTYDDRWYRCLVLNVFDDGNVFVYYVDYGNYEVLPVERLRQLPKYYLRFPMQGLICKLHGLKPRDNEAYWYMQKLLFENQPSDGHFIGKIMSSGPPLEMQLFVQDEETSKQKLAYQNLIDEGVVSL